MDLINRLWNRLWNNVLSPTFILGYTLVVATATVLWTGFEHSSLHAAIELLEERIREVQTNSLRGGNDTAMRTQRLEGQIDQLADFVTLLDRLLERLEREDEQYFDERRDEVEVGRQLGRLREEVLRSIIDERARQHWIRNDDAWIERLSNRRDAEGRRTTTRRTERETESAEGGQSRQRCDLMSPAAWDSAGAGDAGLRLRRNYATPNLRESAIPTDTSRYHGVASQFSDDQDSDEDGYETDGALWDNADRLQPYPRTTEDASDNDSPSSGTLSLADELWLEDQAINEENAALVRERAEQSQDHHEEIPPPAMAQTSPSDLRNELPVTPTESSVARLKREIAERNRRAIDRLPRSLGIRNNSMSSRGSSSSNRFAPAGQPTVEDYHSELDHPIHGNSAFPDNSINNEPDIRPTRPWPPAIRPGAPGSFPGSLRKSRRRPYEPDVRSGDDVRPYYDFEPGSMFEEDIYDGYENGEHRNGGQHSYAPYPGEQAPTTARRSEHQGHNIGFHDDVHYEDEEPHDPWEGPSNYAERAYPGQPRYGVEDSGFAQRLNAQNCSRVDTQAQADVRAVVGLGNSTRIALPGTLTGETYPNYFRRNVSGARADAILQHSSGVGRDNQNDGRHPMHRQRQVPRILQEHLNRSGLLQSGRGVGRPNPTPYPVPNTAHERQAPNFPQERFNRSGLFQSGRNLARPSTTSHPVPNAAHEALHHSQQIWEQRRINGTRSPMPYYNPYFDDWIRSTSDADLAWYHEQPTTSWWQRMAILGEMVRRARSETRTVECPRCGNCRSRLYSDASNLQTVEGEEDEDYEFVYAPVENAASSRLGEIEDPYSGRPGGHLEVFPYVEEAPVQADRAEDPFQDARTGRNEPLNRTEGSQETPQPSNVQNIANIVPHQQPTIASPALAETHPDSDSTSDDSVDSDEAPRHVRHATLSLLEALQLDPLDPYKVIVVSSPERSPKPKPRRPLQAPPIAPPSSNAQAQEVDCPYGTFRAFRGVRSVQGPVQGPAQAPTQAPAQAPAPAPPQGRLARTASYMQRQARSIPTRIIAPFRSYTNIRPQKKATLRGGGDDQARKCSDCPNRRCGRCPEQQPNMRGGGDGDDYIEPYRYDRERYLTEGELGDELFVREEGLRVRNSRAGHLAAVRCSCPRMSCPRHGTSLHAIYGEVDHYVIDARRPSISHYDMEHSDGETDEGSKHPRAERATENETNQATAESSKNVNMRGGGGGGGEESYGAAHSYRSYHNQPSQSSARRPRRGQLSGSQPQEPDQPELTDGELHAMYIRIGIVLDSDIKTYSALLSKIIKARKLRADILEEAPFAAEAEERFLQCEKRHRREGSRYSPWQARFRQMPEDIEVGVAVHDDDYDRPLYSRSVEPGKRFEQSRGRLGSSMERRWISMPLSVTDGGTTARASGTLNLNLRGGGGDRGHHAIGDIEDFGKADKTSQGSTCHHCHNTFDERVFEQRRGEVGNQRREDWRSHQIQGRWQDIKDGESLADHPLIADPAKRRPFVEETRAQVLRAATQRPDPRADSSKIKHQDHQDDSEPAHPTTNPNLRGGGSTPMTSVSDIATMYTSPSESDFRKNNRREHQDRRWREYEELKTDCTSLSQLATLVEGVMKRMKVGLEEIDRYSTDA